MGCGNVWYNSQAIPRRSEAEWCGSYVEWGENVVAETLLPARRFISYLTTVDWVCPYYILRMGVRVPRTTSTVPSPPLRDPINIYPSVSGSPRTPLDSLPLLGYISSHVR